MTLAASLSPRSDPGHRFQSRRAGQVDFRVWPLASPLSWSRPRLCEGLRYRFPAGTLCALLRCPTRPRVTLRTPVSTRVSVPPGWNSGERGTELTWRVPSKPDLGSLSPERGPRLGLGRRRRGRAVDAAWVGCWLHSSSAWQPPQRCLCSVVPNSELCVFLRKVEVVKAPN